MPTRRRRVTTAQVNGLLFKAKLRPEDVVLRRGGAGEETVVLVRPDDHRFQQKVWRLAETAAYPRHRR